MLKLYNTATKSLQEFNPVKPKEVGVYSCGPTVYWNQHIGHMYAYVQWDAMVRLLRYLGYQVKWVMNVTDVGHMTSDEDTGEDKMEKGAKREGVSVWEIADKYIAQFVESLKLLNIDGPDVLARATKHIREQIALAQKIEKNGFTYETKRGLVFDTQKFADYAKFARLDLEKQKTAARDEVEVDPEKKVPWDFFLWVKDPAHTMKWESPWGVGYPGWHLECTAMSTKYLGEVFDIHTGGIEHIAVHHTNEVAQGFGAFGRQTANYWLHNGWLMGSGGEKMSKSLGNYVTAQELVTKGYDPLAMRYLILNSHYRKGLNFSWEALKGAVAALQNLRSIVSGLNAPGSQRTELSQDKLEAIEKYRTRFIGALEDDLNFPMALGVMWEMLRSSIPSIDKYDLLLDFDDVFGLNLRYQFCEQAPEAVIKLAEQRKEARAQKDWVKSDQVRKEIEILGYSVEDTQEGYKLRKLNESVAEK